MHHRHPTGLCLFGLALAACGGGGSTNSLVNNDTIPPNIGTVLDGTAADIATQTSTTTIDANWSGFSDDSGVVAEYRWAIGTSPGGTQVQNWTSVGSATSASNNALALSNLATYYVSVRAFDPSGNGSAVATSNGVQVQAVTGGGGGDGGGGGGSGGGATGTLVSSVSQWGVTWQFAQAVQGGQFCNGDWWVVGPVSITSISPPTQSVSGRQINGSMVNPTTLANGEQGYDSMLYHPFEAGRYQANLNVAIGITANAPLVLTGGKSLISTISYMGASPSPEGSMSQLSTAAVLTVLNAAPAADAFRPPYAGNDKTVLYRESQLDYSVLASLSPGTGAPTMAAIAPRFQRVWLDHCSSWTSRFMHPIQNMPDYGRDFTSLLSTGFLLANLNSYTNAQKRDLVVRLTQIGIDFHGNVLNGATWEGVGGQCSGRKFPILFAGRVLGDATKLNIGFSHPSGYFGPNHPNNRSQFGEDCQTFYVQQTSPGVYNWGYGGYTVANANMPEWGNSHTQYPNNDNVNWTADSYRRCCTANAWVGTVLAARAMGLRDEWNHPALFDYMDRYMGQEAVGDWTRSWEPWQQVMWDLHRSGT